MIQPSRYAEFKVNKIVETLKQEAEKLRISFDGSAEIALREYVDRSEMEMYKPPEIAEAVAVIGWCAIGKVIFESVQWAQMPREIQKQVNPNTVYASDIAAVVAIAHKPTSPGDPCIKVAGTIKQFDIAKVILPEAVQHKLGGF